MTKEVTIKVKINIFVLITEEIISAKYQGVTAMAESSLNYQIVVTCDPMNQLQVRRDALRTIVTTLESHNMHIPYQQLDIHTGK